MPRFNIDFYAVKVNEKFFDAKLKKVVNMISSGCLFDDKIIAEQSIKQFIKDHDKDDQIHTAKVAVIRLSCSAQY